MKLPAQTLAALVCALSVAGARADYFTLTRLADSSTPVPGTSATFTDFSILPPSIHRGSVAFSSTIGKVGVYLYQDGEILTVADSLTNLPGTSAPLESYRAENIEVRDGGVAFIGWAASSPGIYLGDGKGSLRRIAGAGDNLPGSTNVIQSIGRISLDGSNIAFSSGGIYTVVDGVLNRVVDSSTLVPDGGTNIFNVIEEFSMDDDVVLFHGGNMDASSYGIFRVTTSGVDSIIMGGASVPGTDVQVNGFADISFRQDAVGFRALILATLDSALVRYYGDEMRVVAEPGTVADADGNTFVGLFALGFDGGNMAFLASTRSGNGPVKPTALFSQVGSGFQRVLGIGDILDGREVFQILFGYHGVSGNSLAFYVRFTDLSLALYRADLVLEDVVPIAEDLDGEDLGGTEKSNTAYYDPADGTWYVRQDKGSFRTRQFGFPGAQPVAGDYDGDGTGDIAVYDPYYGNWYILASHDGFQAHQFGYYGAQPVQKDYDGDGRCDLGVYDALTGDWFVHGSTDGFRHLQFGFYGATPIPADFDDDGKTDIAVFEHARGNWYVLASTAGFSVRQFGYYGVTPVAVDFDGQGADYAVFDRNSGVWYTLGQVDGFQIRPFGYNGVLPVSADYDGDAKSDLGVYDPYRGIWYLLRTSAGFRSGGL